MREGNPITGKIITDENGNPKSKPGTLKCVKAVSYTHLTLPTSDLV